MVKTLKQRQSNCLKIVLFGPESTGKTTLAKQLATHFKTEWVPEYMRTYLEEKWQVSREKISEEDLIPIALGQLNSENELSEKVDDLLILDTNVLEIKVYSQYYYNGFCPDQILKICKSATYDFYFLTGIDVPWEVDELRDRPNDRAQLFCIFEAQLNEKNLPYHILTGSNKERLSNAIEIITKLLSQRRHGNTRRS